MLPTLFKAGDEKVTFLDELDTQLQRVSVNGLKVLTGDFNARLGYMRAGEEDVMAPWGFDPEAWHRTEVPNRDLLFEYCSIRDLIVANIFQLPAHQNVA